MHKITYRADALTALCNMIAAYREAQAMASDTFGPIREAWERQVKWCREQVRLAIFIIRENDFEGSWA